MIRRFGPFDRTMASPHSGRRLKRRTAELPTRRKQKILNLANIILVAPFVTFSKRFNGHHIWFNNTKNKLLNLIQLFDMQIVYKLSICARRLVGYDASPMAFSGSYSFWYSLWYSFLMCLLNGQLWFEITVKAPFASLTLAVTRKQPFFVTSNEPKRLYA